MTYRGVSLVEILIALLVLALGIAVLVRFQGGVLRSRGIVSQHNEAIQLAEDRLGQLRNYSVLNTTTGKNAYQDIANGTATVAKASTTYTVTWVVAELTDPDHKTVTVTVTWVDSQGVSHNIALSSIIGKINPASSGTVMQGL